MQSRERQNVSRADEDPGFEDRRAEFFVNVTLSKLFSVGAAINSKGEVVTPISELELASLTKEDQTRYATGQIVRASSGLPNNSKAITYLIPPETAGRLANIKSKTDSGRPLKPYPVILTGFNEDGKPIVDYFEHNLPLTEGLRKIARATIIGKGLKLEDISLPLLTIVNNALVAMSKDMGAGNLEEYSRSKKNVII